MPQNFLEVYKMQDNNTKDLNDLLAETREEETAKAKSNATLPLNADIPAKVMKDLRLIAAHKDIRIREIVADLLSKYVKKEKKKMIEDLLKE